MGPFLDLSGTFSRYFNENVKQTCEKGKRNALGTLVPFGTKSRIRDLIGPPAHIGAFFGGTEHVILMLYIIQKYQCNVLVCHGASCHFRCLLQHWARSRSKNAIWCLVKLWGGGRTILLSSRHMVGRPNTYCLDSKLFLG